MTHDETELVEAAAATRPVRQIHALRAFVGAGREVDDDWAFGPDDTASLRELLEVEDDAQVARVLAVAAWVEAVAVEGSRVRTRPLPHEDDLDLWLEVLEELVTDEEAEDEDDEDLAVGELAHGVLSFLSHEPGPAPAGDLVARMVAEVEADTEGGPVEDDAALGALFVALLEQLVEVGAVDDEGGRLEISPLGAWGLEHLDDDGFGELEGETVPELLRLAGEMDAEQREGEVDHWIAVHGVDAFTAGLGDGDVPHLGLAFRGLLRFGDEARTAVEALPSTTALDPYKKVCLATDVTGPDEETTLFPVLAAVADVLGPEAVGPWARAVVGSRLEVVVRDAWRNPDPTVGAALTALGADRSDKAVAKAARASLHRWRSR